VFFHRKHNGLVPGEGKPISASLFRQVGKVCAKILTMPSWPFRQYDRH
jgi:hypothetical protein